MWGAYGYFGDQENGRFGGDWELDEGRTFVGVVRPTSGSPAPTLSGINASTASEQAPQPQWYENIDQLNRLAELLWLQLPPELCMSVSINDMLSISLLKSMLLETPKIVTHLNEQHQIFCRNKNRPVSQESLKLLIIPLQVGTDAAQQLLNHFTLLIIDLEKNQYYYQDSFGTRSDYGEAYRSIHDVMAVFFGRKQLLKEPQVAAIPPKIEQYEQEVKTYGAIAGQPEICLKYDCYQQQLNGRDCGPAVIDNILAVLKAYALGWPSVMFPAIIRQRCYSWGLENYQSYYQKVRQQHQEWLIGKWQQDLLVLERNEEKRKQRQKFSEIILNRPASDQLNAYYKNLFQAFSDVIEYDLLTSELSALDIAITNKISTPESVKQLGALTSGLMGKIIDRLWFFDRATVNLAIDVPWLTGYCEEYIMAIQQPVLVWHNAESRQVAQSVREPDFMPMTLGTLTLGEQTNPVPYDAHFVLSNVPKFLNLREKALREFTEAEAIKGSGDRQKISAEFLLALASAEQSVNIMFPANLYINESYFINEELQKRANKFFKQLTEIYLSLIIPAAKTADEKAKIKKFTHAVEKHEKLIKKLSRIEQARLYTHADYYIVQMHLSDFFAPGICTIS